MSESEESDAQIGQQASRDNTTRRGGDRFAMISERALNVLRQRGQDLGASGSLAIDSGALAVFVSLALHADKKTREAWPSVSVLAELTGLTPRGIYDVIDRLESYGLIKVTRRKGRVNKYVLLDQIGQTSGKAPITGEVSVTREPAITGPVNQDSGGGEPAFTGPVKRPSPEHTKNKEPTHHTNTPAEFEEVWSIYPKKVQLHEAIKTWKEMEAAGALPTVPQLIQSIRAWKQSKQWNKESGQYVPSLGNFLAKERYKETHVVASDSPEFYDSPPTIKMRHGCRLVSGNVWDAVLEKVVQPGDLSPMPAGGATSGDRAPAIEKGAA